MQAKRNTGEPTVQAQLRAIIERFDPAAQKLIRAVRAALRRRLPSANELVYDYSHSLVIGYSPTDRGIGSVVALAARADGVRLYLHGTRLPDPKKLLLGSGRLARYVRVQAASELAHPDVEALIAAAVRQSRPALSAEGKGRLLMRSSAAKRRPRAKRTR
jgi:hypothetical protein